jgi:hypothetical protein
MYSLVAYNWRKYLVKVNSFDLREAARDQPHSFMTVWFDVKDPTVFNNLFAFWSVNELEDITPSERF